LGVRRVGVGGGDWAAFHGNGLFSGMGYVEGGLEEERGRCQEEGLALAVEKEERVPPLLLSLLPPEAFGRFKEDIVGHPWIRAVKASTVTGKKRETNKKKLRSRLRWWSSKRHDPPIIAAMCKLSAPVRY